MEENSIFITQDDYTNDKNITFTNVMDNLPKGYTSVKNKEWRNEKTIKWRWRFLKFNNKTTVEISYKYPHENKRIYFNKNGNWVYRDVPKIYNQYVENIYYYYVDFTL